MKPNPVIPGTVWEEQHPERGARRCTVLEVSASHVFPFVRMRNLESGKTTWIRAARIERTWRQVQP